MTESSRHALAILRDPTQFQWYVIPLLALTVYVYAVEVERKNWNLVFAGLAFWGMDWFNELWNALVLHFTGHAPVWSAPGRTAYLILIGLLRGGGDVPQPRDRADVGLPVVGPQRAVLVFGVALRWI